MPACPPTPPARAHGPGTALLVALLVVLLVVLAGAQLTVTPSFAAAKRYATSVGHHAQVGRLDKKLTAACRRHAFNQDNDHRLYIGHLGDEGPGTTGIAKKGWNLRDPLKLAKPNETYHFKNDGYSTCRVYVARGRGRR